MPWRGILLWFEVRRTTGLPGEQAGNYIFNSSNITQEVTLTNKSGNFLPDGSVVASEKNCEVVIADFEDM